MFDHFVPKLTQIHSILYELVQIKIAIQQFINDCLNGIPSILIVLSHSNFAWNYRI